MGIDRLSEQVDKEGRDLEVLETVIERGPIGIDRIAEETGIDEHKVRYSLRMLENDGLVDPTPDGAVPADDVAASVRAMNEGIDDLIERLQSVREEAKPDRESS
jgi:predicted transcriptional regulator